jgi:hypothetical protein
MASIQRKIIHARPYLNAERRNQTKAREAI